MVLNRDLSQIFTKDYEENYYNMYLDFRDILEPLISNIRLMDDDIEAITFYTSGELLGIRNNILPIGDLKSKAWYDGFRGRRWIVDGEKLYLVQELISNPKDSNFMVISIQHDSIFADLDNLSEHVAVHIEDAKQHVIFQKNHERAVGAVGLKVGDPGDLSLSRSLASNGWTIHYNLLNTNAYANAMGIFQITLFVIILSLIITFLLIYVISNNFTQRIIHIKNKVDKVERNNLDVIIRSSSRDEFGELTNGIGKMLKRINSLISQVYHAEIAKQENQDYEPYGKYETPVEFTIGRNTNHVNNLPSGDTIEDNLATRYVEDRVNVKAKVAWETDDMDQKLSLSMTTGDLPDVMLVSREIFNQLVDNDLIADMTEVYEKTASEGVK
ncbi:hypothetical protein PC120_g26780, partial [Phytophthora cactorum]